MCITFFFLASTRNKDKLHSGHILVHLIYMLREKKALQKWYRNVPLTHSDVQFIGFMLVFGSNIDTFDEKHLEYRHHKNIILLEKAVLLFCLVISAE